MSSRPSLCTPQFAISAGTRATLSATRYRPAWQSHGQTRTLCRWRLDSPHLHPCGSYSLSPSPPHHDFPVCARHLSVFVPCRDDHDGGACRGDGRIGVCCFQDDATGPSRRITPRWFSPGGPPPVGLSPGGPSSGGPPGGTSPSYPPGCLFAPASVQFPAPTQYHNTFYLNADDYQSYVRYLHAADAPATLSRSTTS